MEQSVVRLHELIKEGKLSEVKSLVDAYPQEKNFYDVNRKSAAATALLNRELDIYEFLLTKNLSTGPHERVSKLLKSSSINDKLTVHKIHMKFLSDPKFNYLRSLYSKYSYNITSDSKQEFSEIIEEAFEQLDKIDWIRPILKIVACADNLKIIFDFNNQSVDHMDPSKSENDRGICYYNGGKIMVGAAGLLINEEEEDDDKECYSVLGTLIHELTHYAMKMIYNNQCRPFCANDKKASSKFQDVLYSSSKVCSNDKCIDLVFQSDAYKDARVSELIVRVPQLLALYMYDELKLEECRKKFGELFEFYEQYTLIDMRKEAPLLEEKLKLNQTCGILARLHEAEIVLKPDALNFDIQTAEQKNVLIFSNFVELTMNSLYCEYKNNSELVIISLYDLEDKQKLESLLKAYSLISKPKVIVDCNGCNAYEIQPIFEILKMHDLKDRVILILSENITQLIVEDVVQILISIKWEDFTTEYQSKLYKREINFQGNTVSLNDLADNRAMNTIGFEQLNNLIKRQSIKIGAEINSEEIETFVERNFLEIKLNEAFDFTANFDLSQFLINKGSITNQCHEHTFNQLLNFADEHKIILISDEPGMGKSTELKMIAKRLKKEFPLRWVVFLDLKAHYKLYKKDEAVLTSHQNKEEIINFIALKVLLLQNFEAEIFASLYEEDRVILLLDGYDEICPSYKNFITNFIMGIKKASKNQIWITTRPHLQKELIENLKPQLVKLKPFSRENRLEYFVKIFGNKITVRKNLDRKVSEAETFLNRLNSRKIEPVSNPQLLFMIAEIFDEDTDVKLTDFNMYSIYDRFTKILRMRCIKNIKTPDATEYLAEQMEKPTLVEFYQKTAFKIIFSNCLLTHRFDVLRMIHSCFRDIPEPSVDDGTRVGLLYSNGEQFDFIHRTFAEFYVAKVFFDVVFCRNFRSEEISKATKKVLISVLCSDLPMILTFIESALETLKKVEKISILDIFENILERNQNFIVCSRLVINGCINLINISFQSLSNESSRDFWSKNHNENIFAIAILKQSKTFIDEFCRILERYQPDLIKTLILQNMILLIALRNPDPEVFEYCLKKVNKYRNIKDHGLEGMFCSPQDSRQNIILCSFLIRRDFNHIFGIIEKTIGKVPVERLLTHIDVHKSTILHHICMAIHINIENYYQIFEFFRRFVSAPGELKKFFNELDENNHTALMLAAVNPNLNVLTLICGHINKLFDNDVRDEVLLHENSSGLSAFHLATMSGEADQSRFELALKLYNEFFGIDLMT